MTQTHEDPFGDARSRLAQTLAIAATVGEAAARWYATGLHRRSVTAARYHDAQRASTVAGRIAWQTQQRADRALIDLGLTSWINRAGVDETVRLWRTATIYAGAGNARAAAAARRARDRLREMNPAFMAAYDRHRNTGMRQGEAMCAAAHDMWEAEARGRRTARPHGGSPYRPAIDSGRGLPAASVDDEFDQAVRAETARLADGLDVQGLEPLIQSWRESGMNSAADALSHLTEQAAAANAADLGARAADEQRSGEFDRARANASPPDVGLERRQDENRSRFYDDRADAGRAAAAEQQRLMGDAFAPLTDLGTRQRNSAPARPGIAPPRHRGRNR